MAMLQKRFLCIISFAVFMKVLIAFNVRTGFFKINKRRNLQVKECLLKQMSVFTGKNEKMDKTCDEQLASNTISIENIFSPPLVPELNTKFDLPFDTYLSVVTDIKAVSFVQYTAVARWTGIELDPLDIVGLIEIEKESNHTKVHLGENVPACIIEDIQYLLPGNRMRVSWKLLWNNNLEIFVENAGPCIIKFNGPVQMTLQFLDPVYSAKLIYK